VQAFSGMQRSRNDQNPLTRLSVVALFIVYEALSMRYLFLPPLFGVLFYLYIHALDTGDSKRFFSVAAMLLVAETAKGYPLFSTVAFYTFSYFTVLPKLRVGVSCPLCVNGLIVVYGYLGYWAFLALLSSMFVFASPQIDFRLLFYMLIEFFVVGLL